MHPDAGALSIAKPEVSGRGSSLSADTIGSLVKWRYGSSLPVKNIEVIHAESSDQISIQFTIGNSMFRAWLNTLEMRRAAGDQDKMCEVVCAPFAELKKIQSEAEQKGAARERETTLAKIEERTRTIKQTETLIVAIADKVGVKL
jgi:hypothetical protein